MGSGASVNKQDFKNHVVNGLKMGALSVKQIQSFLDKESDIKSALKTKIPRNKVDFDHLNIKDVDYVLDELDDDIIRQVLNRMMGIGYKAPSIMGGKKHKMRSRKRGGKKLRRTARGFRK
jgi:hypothetical protein